MKQVISINLQGIIIPIEQTAFDSLKKYTEKLQAYFSNEEGREEIINDIENRIVELFQQRLHAGAVCITDADVEAVIKSIGQPEDFDERDGGNEKSEPDPIQPDQSASRRLFRDERHKVLGGVCSGLANYINIDVVIVRIIFILLFGVLFLPYIILWIAVPGTTAAEIGSQRKKLYRDGDKKIIAGVCSGLGYYFHINPWIPRILFLISFFSYSWDLTPFHSQFMSIKIADTAVLVYILLWIILPKAKTASEKLEMKGEKVDMQSIRNTVVEEIKEAGQRISAAAGEVSQKTGEKGKEIASEKKGVASRAGESISNIVQAIVKIVGHFLKIIGYFFAAILLFILFSILLGFGFSASAVFPLKDFIIRTSTQEMLAWGTLLFFFLTPIIGAVYWLIRRLTKNRNHSGRIRLTFLTLWIVGWISMALLAASIGREFSHYASTTEEPVFMERSDFDGLTISSGAKTPDIDFPSGDQTLTPGEIFTQDSFHINNMRINILKSPADSFVVKMKKRSFGRSIKLAEENCNRVTPFYKLVDSNLIVDPGIYITKENKFRNQSIILYVYVPVGRKITLRTAQGFNGVYFLIPDFPFFYQIGPDQEDFEALQSGRTYIMREDGLYTADGNRVRGVMDY